MTVSVNVPLYQFNHQANNNDEVLDNVGEEAEKDSRANAGTDDSVQGTFCHPRLG